MYPFSPKLPPKNEHFYLFLIWGKFWTHLSNFSLACCTELPLKSIGIVCIRVRNNLWCWRLESLYRWIYLPFFVTVSQSVQLLSHVQLSATPWTAAHQASLSITNSWSLLKLMSIKSVMPSNCLVFCYLLLLLPSIFPSIRVFSNELALPIR